MKYGIKLRFHSVNLNVFAVIGIIGDSNSEKFLEYESFLSKKTLQLDLHDSWDNFYNNLIKLKEEHLPEEGLFNIFMTLQRYFKDKYPVSKVKKISEIITSSPDKEFRNLLVGNVFKEELQSILMDPNLEFEIDVENLDNNNEVKTENIQYDNKNINDNKFVENVIPDGAIIFKCNPIIEPINGVNAENLKIGDKIFIHIIPQNKIEQHISKSVTNSEKPEEVDIIAPVFKINKKKEFENLDAPDVVIGYVYIDEGILAEFKLQPQAKVKMKLTVEGLESNNDIQEARPADIDDIVSSEAEQLEVSPFMWMIPVLIFLVIFVIMVFILR